jgi:hypothetical protein
MRTYFKLRKDAQIRVKALVVGKFAAPFVFWELTPYLRRRITTNLSAQIFTQIKEETKNA